MQRHAPFEQFLHVPNSSLFFFKTDHWRQVIAVTLAPWAQASVGEAISEPLRPARVTLPHDEQTYALCGKGSNPAFFRNLYAAERGAACMVVTLMDGSRVAGTPSAITLNGRKDNVICFEPPLHLNGLQACLSPDAATTAALREAPLTDATPASRDWQAMEKLKARFDHLQALNPEYDFARQIHCDIENFFYGLLRRRELELVAAMARKYADQPFGQTVSQLFEMPIESYHAAQPRLAERFRVKRSQPLSGPFTQPR